MPLVTRAGWGRGGGSSFVDVVFQAWLVYVCQRLLADRCATDVV